ncbi:HDR065Cp [Eremothecium sinecaudum]|uniref:HDR065Cp n=1 Tax=Eremothecium sinecaudum TaxID=45286 RepID=A0A109UZ52_9SACH|nr:HDR065Cp [Eremothecium sinecaudum]AMD20807.1 HDR065Cp [Eremothecium sinecaudum]
MINLDECTKVRQMPERPKDKLGGVKKEWRRLLWLKQPYADTYTDPKFLEVLDEIKKGPQSKQECSNYSDVVIDFLTFHHTLANSSLVYIIFALVYRFHYSLITLAAFTTILSSWSRLFWAHFKSSMIIIFTMLTLSPVLKTLSKSTSSDSIWTLSCWLTIFYVLSLSWSKTSILPTNILLSNVTVLASRLNTTTEVFCFLLICIELNILLPNYERKLRSGRYLLSYGGIFVTTHIIVYTFVTRALGWHYAVPLAALSMTFLFIVPWYFIYWERNYYKGHKLLSTWDAKFPILD